MVPAGKPGAGRSGGAAPRPGVSSRVPGVMPDGGVQLCTQSIPVDSLHNHKVNVLMLL